MKKYIILFVITIFGLQVGFAQDEETKEPKKTNDRPVTEMFGSSLLIDEQTSVIPTKKTLEMQIQHRFGLIKENGISDLFGIYAPSANTRMGLNYSILDNLMVGYGITRKNMYSDFQVKWNILRQTRKNTMPLTLTLYANMAINGQNSDVFKTVTADSTYKFANRFSYFTQIGVSRKFTDWLSLEATGSFTHYNSVPADTAHVSGMNHDVFGFSVMGRFKFSPQASFIISYSQPLVIGQISENTNVTFHSQPNFSFGIDISTATHAFQIFFTTSNGIISEDIYMWNDSKWTAGDWRIGFNITRLWEF
jgi:hypothetical protein